MGRPGGHRGDTSIDRSIAQAPAAAFCPTLHSHNTALSYHPGLLQLPTNIRRTPVRMMAEGEGGSKHGGLVYDKSKALAGDANSSNYRCVFLCGDRGGTA